MVSPRDVLNKLKWQKGFDISLCKICYIHRGAPDDTKIISGDVVVKLEKSFMKTSSAMIPYHRIFKIVYKDQVVFQREKK